MSGMGCKLEASPGAAARFAARWRGLTPAASAGGARPATRSGACPSSRGGYTWVIGWNGRKTAEQKSSDQRRFIETLGRIEPAIAVAGSLARHFLGLIHRRDVRGCDRWLVDARR